MLEREKFATVSAEFLAVMANALRLRILCALSEEELTVFTLAERMRISQPRVSHHLHILRDHRLVSTRRETPYTFYRCTDPAAKAMIAILDEIVATNR